MLDHIVFAAPDLAAAQVQFAELTGVSPVPGGSHVGMGTANYLAGLGEDAYLEIIGPDPAQPSPPHPRPFGIDELTAARVVTWAIHPLDFDHCIEAARARGYDPGPPQALSRTTPDGEVLHWRFTRPTPTIGQGLVPFLIDWGKTLPPPSRGLPVIRLAAFEATHPAPEGVRAALAALGADLVVRAGNQAGLTVVLNGQHGPVVLT